MTFSIRDERAGDSARIAAVTNRAFAASQHGDQGEAAIIERLRASGALTLSLVAEEEGRLVGHAAFSPVAIGGETGWFGLGPVSVEPECQGAGIGHALIVAGIDRLRARGARGCVVLGDADYYGRFGFAHRTGVTFGDVPPPYLQIMSFGETAVIGNVAYHPAFGG